MSPLAAGLTQVVLVVAVLGLAHRPMGAYIARVMTSPAHTRVERGVYRMLGVDPDAEQRWMTYYLSVLAFSFVSVVVLYVIVRVQSLLPAPWGGRATMNPLLAANTAISFVTNTNWQAYSGEKVLGFAAQMGGIAVQNFASAAVGLCVAIALIRGLTRDHHPGLGNFWVDLTRAIGRILLPLSVVAALVLVCLGVVDSFAGAHTVTTLTGAHQTLVTGPVASQEAIKELGTNGGGYFGANSAHPFENPTAWTNLVEIILILLIPTALPRTFGIMVGQKRQGWAILAAMGVLAVASTAATMALEWHARAGVFATNGAMMEGKEVRFGVIPSALFASATTLTSTGAVDSAHASFSGGARALLMLNMLIGEVAPGGVGSGLYGILIVAMIAVFLAGLMVGRTPEYLGKRIGPREMTLISLYTLITPILVLVGTAVCLGISQARAAMSAPGAGGFSELLYAFASAGNNNGSAMGGLYAQVPPIAVATSLAMVCGRFIPICFVLALAGRLATAGRAIESAGTLPTHRPLFIGVMVGVAVLIAGLTFVPALALGPVVEGLS